MQRRTFLKLAMVTAACAKPPAALPDGLLHARPQSAPPSPLTTPRPQRLGLASGRDGSFYAPPRHHDAPVLLYLHGATGSGERAIARFTDYAERTGTIVVAPDSREYTWGLVTSDEDADLAFIDRVLNKVFASCSVDARRIAVAGFSDGASAALSWGLLNGDLFCGIAAFSPGFIHLTAEPHGQPKVFISHGTQDPILPIDRCGRRIAGALKSAGYDVNYQEFDGEHTVPPEIRDTGLTWLLG
jgi:phospholipase/carboxylesterase